MSAGGICGHCAARGLSGSSPVNSGRGAGCQVILRSPGRVGATAELEAERGEAVVPALGCCRSLSLQATMSKNAAPTAKDHVAARVRPFCFLIAHLERSNVGG